MKSAPVSPRAGRHFRSRGKEAEGWNQEAGEKSERGGEEGQGMNQAGQRMEEGKTYRAGRGRGCRRNCHLHISATDTWQVDELVECRWWGMMSCN